MVLTCKQVRWNYGFYGWYSIFGTEAEQLGSLCSDILNRFDFQSFNNVV